MNYESDTPEDIQEIESRLYSQVFHDSNVDQINDKKSSVLNNEPNQNVSRQQNRYWNRIENKFQGAKPMTVRTKNIKPSIVKINPNSKSENTPPEICKKEVLSFLKPYEPIIFQPKLEEDIKKYKIEDSSENSTKSNVNNFNRKKLQHQHKKNATKQNQNSKIIHSYKNIANKNNHHHKMTMANQTKQKKLDSVKRIREKKAKSESIRNRIKTNEQKQKDLEIISLDDIEENEDDNDDDNDDVICIPAPQPPVIAIDESDDEDKEIVKNDNVLKDNFPNKNISHIKMRRNPFAKPKNKKSSSAPVSAVQSNNSSRCTSPCSVISVDDFISQGEKSKLLEISVVDDDDLTLTETVESFVSRKNKIGKTKNQIENQNTFDMPPPSDIKSNYQQKKKKKSDNKAIYLVKHNDCRAIDVYDESESDFSVYSKGSLSNKRPTDNNDLASFEVLSSSSSSFSDSIQTDIVQKVKRLRKRRASSNKGSDKKNSESESEDEINKRSTGLPYITKGEAVESVKKRRRVSEPNLNVLGEINSSDNEFISKLSNIVNEKIGKGTKTQKNVDHVHNDSEISDEAEVSISARKIAEDVLKKSQKKINNVSEPQSETVIEESNSLNSVSNKEQLKTPIEEGTINKSAYVTEEQLKEAFEEINNLNLASEICREITPEMDSFDITQSDIEDDAENVNKEENEMNFGSTEIEVDGVTYYKIDSHSTSHMGWCEEMYRFYNMSWGGENFTVKGIKQTLNRKSNWSINSNDRFPKFSKHSKMKCFNCCEFGHISAKCTLPRKPLICYMCGEQGHREPRCPNTICLKCGSKTNSYTRQCMRCITQKKQTCFICKLAGHTVTTCPDKWRRYHSTVSLNSDINNRIKYSNIKYCSVCAAKGHLAEQCKFAKIYLEYPTSTYLIKSHVKPIPSQPNSSILSNSTITYNLLYQPTNNIHFSFSFNKRFKQNEYYGRFLKAVKLEHLIYKIFSNDEPSNKSKRQLILNSDKNTYNSKDSGKIQAISEIPKNSKMEHQFKSPIVTEKVTTGKEERTSVQEQQNKSANKDSDSTTSKDFVCDSDSNYSFSDHFDVPKSTPVKSKETQNATFRFTKKTDTPDFNKPQRIARPMGDLLDFIPLGDSNDNNFDAVPTDKSNKTLDKGDKNEENSIGVPKNNEDSSKITFNESDDVTDEINNEDELTNRGGIGISYRFRNLSESDVDESSFPDIPRFGKIFLPKQFSDYLLSPNGNKFLIENSNKYNVKTSIDWTSVGNVLVLEGLKENQNKFHIKLLLELRSLPKNISNEILENSLRVPKKRSVLVKFLQDDLERLDSKIGNVFDLHKQLQLYEHQQSKNGLRQAQKLRTKLNMILLGQAGLRDGKINLEMLLKHLMQLRKENQNLVYVSSKIRDEIDKSWKYIFSPLEHSNYNDLIDDYYDLKRRNALPLLKIRERIKNGNLNFVNNSITFNFIDNTLDNINTKEEQNESETSKNQLKRKENFTGLNEILNSKIPKLFLNITDSNKSFSTFLNENIKNNFDNNDTIKKRFQNKSYLADLKKIEDLLDNINDQNSSRVDKKSLSAKAPSPFWSNESTKYLNEVLRKHSWNPVVEKKITTALNHAVNGKLSHSDFRNVVSIKNIVNLIVDF